MKPSYLTIFAVTALAFAGCAAQRHAPTLLGPAIRVVEFPGAPGTGQPREVHSLVDEPALKLVTIVLRAGTSLPVHQANVPVTIIALQGSGTVIAGVERLHIDSTHAVVLGAGVSHAVEPDPDMDVVLLVHHLGRAEETRP